MPDPQGVQTKGRERFCPILWIKGRENFGSQHRASDLWGLFLFSDEQKWSIWNILKMSPLKPYPSQDFFPPFISKVAFAGRIFRWGKIGSQAEGVAGAGCTDPKSCSLGSCPVLCGAAQFLGTDINVQQHAQTIFLNGRKETLKVLASPSLPPPPPCKKLHISLSFPACLSHITPHRLSVHPFSWQIHIFQNYILGKTLNKWRPPIHRWSNHLRLPTVKCPKPANRWADRLTGQTTGISALGAQFESNLKQ